MSVTEKGKKVLSFIFLTSTINRRNVTSIGLVVIFMIVYALSGGKIFMAPRVKTGAGFGSMQGNPTDKPVRILGDVLQPATDAAKTTPKNVAKERDKALFGSSSKPNKATTTAPDSAHAGRPVADGNASLSELQQRLDKLNVDKRNGGSRK